MTVRRTVTEVPIAGQRTTTRIVPSSRPSRPSRRRPLTMPLVVRGTSGVNRPCTPQWLMATATVQVCYAQGTRMESGASAALLA